MKILVVDDHDLFREGLVSIFANREDLLVVGEAGTADEALRKTRELQPDIVLLDNSLPDRDGVSIVKDILNIKADAHVIILTAHESEPLLFQAIANGAKGYLLKNIQAKNLLETLKGLERGEAALSRTMTSKLLTEFSRMSTRTEINEDKLLSLTPREMEILRLLVEGLVNQEIAKRLYISDSTVKVHIHNIMDKLEMKKKRDLILYAKNLGPNLNW